MLRTLAGVMASRAVVELRMRGQGGVGLVGAVVRRARISLSGMVPVVRHLTVVDSL